MLENFDSSLHVFAASCQLATFLRRALRLLSYIRYATLATPCSQQHAGYATLRSLRHVGCATFATLRSPCCVRYATFATLRSLRSPRYVRYAMPAALHARSVAFATLRSLCYVRYATLAMLCSLRCVRYAALATLRWPNCVRYATFATLHLLCYTPAALHSSRYVRYVMLYLKVHCLSPERHREQKVLRSHWATRSTQARSTKICAWNAQVNSSIYIYIYISISISISVSIFE